MLLIKNEHLLYMRNIKKSCKNKKFKISAPTWKDKFEVPDGSFSVSDIFWACHQENGTGTDDPPIKKYIYK